MSATWFGPRSPLALSAGGLRVMAVALGRDLGAPEVGDEAATRGVVLASID